MSVATRFSGSFRDVGQINELLTQAAEQCILLSPVTSCHALPEGFELFFSSVLIDARDASEGGDVYPSFKGAKTVSLKKTALERIMRAAGGFFHPEETRRIDDGSKGAFYCEYEAVAYVPDLLGVLQPYKGTKVVDLRDGGEDMRKCATQAQLDEARRHIVTSTETKAMSAAIRRLGIKGAYFHEELKKPFVVVHSKFTGRSEDPVLSRQFALMLAQNYLQAQNSLYGGRQHGVARPSRVNEPPALTLVPSPSPSALLQDVHPDNRPAERLALAEAEPEAKPPMAKTNAARRAVLMPKWVEGEAGLPLEEASDRGLQRFEIYLQNSLKNPEKAKYRAANEQALEEVTREQERRSRLSEVRPTADDDIPY